MCAGEGWAGAQECAGEGWVGAQECAGEGEQVHRSVQVRGG